MGRSPAITAWMSSGSKPAPRVEARSRVGLSWPGSQERDHAAPPMLDGKAGLLHEPQERRKVAGLFLQGRDDSQPHPLLGRGRLFPDPLTVMEKAALAVQFGILDIGQLVLNAHPVR